MHIIEKTNFYKALHAAGYQSARELCRQIGIHRNSLSGYLTGKGVLPDVIEKALAALNIKAADILTEVVELEDQPGHEVFSIVDQLHDKFSQYSFFLFGSRAREKHKKFSDFDVGIYPQRGIPFEEYLKIVQEKTIIVEDFPYMIDLVNLTSADDDFLMKVKNDLILLAGEKTDLMALKAHHEKQ